MKLAAYGTREGALLLVPSILKPSRRAEALHGPLTYRAQLESDAFPTDVWEPLFEGLPYVVIPRRHAHSLLGTADDDEQPPSSSNLAAS